jgi:hypothetical protein
MEHGEQTTTWIGKNKLLAIVQCHSKFSFEWN